MSEPLQQSQPGKTIAKFLVIILAVICGGCILIAPKMIEIGKTLKHYRQGRASLEAEKYQQAYVEYQQVLYFQPDFEPARNDAEYAYEKLSSYEKVSACFELTQIISDLPDGWNCRGLLRYDLELYKIVLQELEPAIAVDPNLVIGWYNKGEVLLKLGRHKEAISATHQVLKLKPDFYLAWTQICQALYELEQYQDAKAHCEESKAINPNYQPTLTLLKQIEQQL